MSALDKLIEAVEAGDATGHLVRQVFDTPCQDMARQRIKPTVWMAYKGSLDAALSLHEALLPGRWLGELSGNRGPKGDSWLAEVNWEKGGTVYSMDGVSTAPARAWLLAILRAYRSVQA